LAIASASLFVPDELLALKSTIAFLWTTLLVFFDLRDFLDFSFGHFPSCMYWLVASLDCIVITLVELISKGFLAGLFTLIVVFV